MVDFSKPAEEKDVYPAVQNFRIITDAAVISESALKAALSGYDVVSPLAKGRASSAGKYIVYEVSVRLTSRAEHFAVDGAIKAVSGVKILL